MPQPNNDTLRNMTTIKKDGMDPFFVMGDEHADREAGGTVAIAVNVNFTLDDGERKHGHSISVHEIPLRKRLYPASKITLHPEWAPALPRERELKSAHLKSEIERLRASYTIPGEQGKRDLFGEVYGTTEAEQVLSLQAGMRKIVLAWRKLREGLIAQVKKQYPNDNAAMQDYRANCMVTEPDLWKLVALVEPMPETLETINIDEIDLSSDGPMRADAPPSGNQGGQKSTTLVADLVARGIGEEAAEEIEVLFNDVGSDITDDLLAQVTGMAKTDGTLHLKKAESVRKALAAFVPAATK